MKAFGWRLLSVFGSALVLMFFSEFYFVNEGPVSGVLELMAQGWSALPVAVLGQLEFAIFYALFAYVFLIVIDRFAVRTLAGLYLAGSIFGFAAEATIVPAAHEAPPVSWMFTSTTWHPIVDVLLGWFLLRRAMRTMSWPWLVLIFTTLGIVWAYWATWYWGGADPGDLAPMTTIEFDRFSAVTGILWIAGMVLADLGATRVFRASNWEIGVIGVLSVGLLVFSGLPYLPWSLGLFVVIGLTFAALWRGKACNAGACDLLEPLSTMPHPLAYGLTILTPFTAAIGYRLVLATGQKVPTDLVVSVLLLAGTGVFLWSLWQVSRGR